jgi:hypothetical protein
MASIRVLLLSSDRASIENAIRRELQISNVVILPLDEKTIARFRFMISLLRAEHSDAVCFACKDLSNQRYQFVLMSYLLIGRGRSKFIVDESGQMLKFSAVRYFAVLLPVFALELCASILVLGRAFIRLPFLGRAVRRESTRQ